MSGAVLQSLGWALVHLLWQGALVAGVLAVALTVLGRKAASARYLMACAALASMLVLPTVTGWRHYASLQAEPSAPAPRVPRQVAAPVNGVAPRVAAVERAPEALPVVEQARTLLGEHMPWLVLAWGLGVGVASLRLLSGWLKLRRLVDAAEPAPTEWQEALARLSEKVGLRRTVRLLQSAAIEVPAAVGWLKPVVLLPVATLTGLPARQLEMILAHELAHIRRHDFAVNLVQTLVETLLFYHPAVWWMSHVIRAEREHCCDDIAVDTSGNAVSYARALTALEALRVLPHLGATSPALSALGGSLPQRVRRIVGAPIARCSSRWVAGASVLTLLSGMAVAVPLAALALPQPPTPPSVVAPAAPPAPPSPPANLPPSVEVTEVEPPEPPAPPMLLAQAHPDHHPNSHPNPQPKPHPRPGKEHDDEDDTTRVDAQKLSVDQLISLKVAGVTPERVKEVEAMGFEPTVGNLVQLGHAGVTPEYVKEMRAAVGPNLSAEDVTQMKHLGVSMDFIRELKAAGFDKLSAEDLSQAAAVGVKTDFIRAMKGAGYEGLSLDDLTQMRAVGVSPEYITALKDAGYAKLPADDVVQLRALGVDGAYIRSMREAGLDKLSAEDLGQLRALGVNADFVRKMRDAGLENPTVDELVRLRASGVDDEFIRKLRKK
jgi:beta-lactamase regulating signal transducer with metallopeptidase domain